MEIEISKKSACVAILVICVSLVLAIGISSSPRSMEGRPLLLSPERRAVLRFLRQADRWERELRGILDLLDDLSEEIRMAPAPENLYERAHRAQDALERIRSLEQDMARARVPETMTALHGLAMNAAEKTREYAEEVASRVGVPEGPIPGQAEAHHAVEQFGRALREARGAP